MYYIQILKSITFDLKLNYYIQSILFTDYRNGIVANTLYYYLKSNCIKS